jgi:hypothetical protein
MRVRQSAAPDLTLTLTTARVTLIVEAFYTTQFAVLALHFRIHWKRVFLGNVMRAQNVG